MTTSTKLFAAVLGFAIVAATTRIAADAFTSYLLGKSIRAVIYDPHRQLFWLGSEEGDLISFDGSNLKYYKPPSTKNYTPLAISALALDPEDQHSLWIGTSNVGAIRFQPEKNKWDNFEVFKTNGDLSNNVWSLKADGVGRLWVGTNGSGIVSLDTNRVWYRYTKAVCEYWTGSQWQKIPNCTSSLASDTVRAIDEDSGGNIFFATDQGISWLDSAKAWQPTLLSGKKFLSVHIDRQGNRWFGTGSNGNSDTGVFKFSAGNIHLELQPTDTPACVRRVINAITSDSDNNLWFGHTFGAVSLNPSDTLWRCESGSILDGYWIASIAASEDGVICFGSPNRSGAIKYLSNWVNFSQKTSTLKGNEAMRMDLNGFQVNALMKASHGQVWMATFPGVARFTETWVPFLYFPSCENPNLTNYRNDMSTIVEAHDGTLWLGSYGGGVLQIDANGVCRDQFAQAIGDPLNSDTILALAFDGDILWIGTPEGLNQVNTRTKEWGGSYTTAEGLLSDRVQALAVDGDHNLWIGTLAGVCKLDRFRQLTCLDGTQAREIIGVGGVSAITVDHVRNRIWFATTGNGAAYLENASVLGAFTAAPDGLANNHVQDIQLANNRREIWFATISGVSVWNDSTGRWTKYTSDDGLPANNATRLLIDEAAGYFWIGTLTEGLVRYHPLSIPPNTYIDTPLEVTTKPEIEYRFHGIDRNTGSQQLRYAYNLNREKDSVGREKWNYTGETLARIRIPFNGKHTFYVKAIDKDNNEDTSPATDTFIKIDSYLAGRTASNESYSFPGLEPVKVAIVWPPNVLGDAETIDIQPAPEDTSALFAFDLEPEDAGALVLTKPATLTFFFPRNARTMNEKWAVFREQPPNPVRLGGKIFIEEDTLSISVPMGVLGRYSVREDRDIIPTSQNQEGYDKYKKAEIITIQPRSFSPRGGGHGTETTVSFFLPQEAQVSVRVFNLSGRLVRTVFEGGMGRGLQAVSWNGRDRDNQFCPTGLYIMAIDSDQFPEPKPKPMVVMVLNE